MLSNFDKTMHILYKLKLELTCEAHGDNCTLAVEIERIRGEEASAKREVDMLRQEYAEGITLLRRHQTEQVDAKRNFRDLEQVSEMCLFANVFMCSPSRLLRLPMIRNSLLIRHN